MFKQSKWEAWYEAQPQHIKNWLDQPHALWHDIDMFKAFLVGVTIGVAVGLVL